MADVVNILDELQNKALKDEKLKQQLLATRTEADPVSAFCKTCRDLGYELYGSECDAARQKGIEQKIRRAIQKAQSHLAARGSEDFYDEIFTEYASRLFDFGQVQQEMRMLQGKGSQSGKINTKKFFEGILLKLED